MLDMFNGHVNFYHLVNQSTLERLLEVFCVCVPHSFSETSALFTFTGIPLCLCDNVWFTIPL